MTAPIRSDEPETRGPDAVRSRLVDAATELLTTRAPTQVTGREIAEHAGVNHGQIHHYFGSKDGLVAATVAEGARYRQDRLRESRRFPLPIQTVERPAMWRTVAHLAITDKWRQPPFEPSPVVAALIERRSTDLACDPSDLDVMAEVAATISLQRGWWVFRDIIEHALRPFDSDVDAVRAELADRSRRLIDRDLPVVEPVQSDPPALLPPLPMPEQAGRGPDEVRSRLVAAAAHVFVDRPPNDVTTKEIAALAGVNHGQVHHYFESKDHLIATVLRYMATQLMESRQDQPPAPVSIEHRQPLWRTLGYLAATEQWAQEAYDRAPLVAHLVNRIADRTGEPVTSPAVHAQAAALHALELGWNVYRDLIEYGLEPFGADLSAVRRRLAAISTRLVDPPVLSS